MQVPGESRWRVGDVIDGRYEVTLIHEQGGMGLVYRVRHLLWGTNLAVKSPRPELFRHPADQERFVTEAQTWVSLGLHPNVCCCHYVRTLDGIPRVFAEYLPGGSLREWIDKRGAYRGDRLELATLLGMAIQFAWGLEHAHNRGLVHQDVKPANVLLDGFGTVKVTDFGLAKARAAAVGAQGPPGVSVGVPGGGFMTPAYASPEQLAGELVGRRSDIYSFAVSVLDLCTGGVSWMAGPAAGAALAAHQAARPTLPPALADLLARCLDHDQARRPGSMAEVAAELVELYQQLTGGPYPRRVPVAADLRADEYNNWALSLLDLGDPETAEEVFEAALKADPHHLPATYNSGLERWRRGASTDEELIVRLEAIRADTGDPWQARHLLAQVHLERGDLAAAEPLLAGIDREDPEAAAALDSVRSGLPAGSGPVDIREVPWRVLPDDQTGLFERITSYVPIRLSADGRWAVTGGPGAVARLWDIHSGQLKQEFGGHHQRVHSVSISADGSVIATADANGTVRVWDPATAQRRHEFAANARVLFPLPPLERYPVELSDDGRLLLWPGPKGSIQVHDPRSGELRFNLVQNAARIELITISAGGRFALSCDKNQNHRSIVNLWDLDSGRRLRAAGGFTLVGAVWISRDGSTAMVAGRDIEMWDLMAGGDTLELEGHAEMVESLSVSADGRFLLSGAKDNTARLWDLNTGRCLRTLQDHRSHVSAVLLSQDGQSGISAGQDNTVRRWTLRGIGDYAGAFQLVRPRQHAELSRLTSTVQELVAEANQALAAGQYATALDRLTRARATPGYERAPEVLSAWQELGRYTVRVGLRATRPAKTITTGLVMGADLSADGHTVVTDVLMDKVQVWDVASGSCLRSIVESKLPPGPVELSPDGYTILNTSRDRTLMVWSIETGYCLWVLDRSERSAVARFSADGRQVLTGTDDGAVRVWDLASKRCRRTMSGHSGIVTALWAGADGRLVASAAQDGIRLWDLDSGSCLHTLSEHPGRVMSLCLSADGRFLLSSGDDGDRTIRLWDTGTGACVRVFDESPATANTVRFTTDGRFVLSGCSDAAIRIWDVTSGKCLRTLEGHQRPVYDVIPSADGRIALSMGGDSIRLWELDWELSARDQADWDDGATALLEAFLSRHRSVWSAADAEALLRRLQHAGYGWLRPERVLVQLERLNGGPGGTAPPKPKWWRRG